MYKTGFSMDDMTAVRRAVDRLLGGDLGPMLDLLAEDVEFEVEEGGDSPERRKAWGKQAVADHFAALGELVAFWQIDYGPVDGQVIAWGKESFTVDRCGLEGGCEFALVFDRAGGRITRFLVIEDLTRFPRRRRSSRAERGIGRLMRVSSGVIPTHLHARADPSLRSG
ncbi:MAG: nuclear transport factor 2 family protein [Gemmatimonadales bacterium]